MTRKLFITCLTLLSTTVLAQTNRGSVQLSGRVGQSVAMRNAVLTTSAGGREIDNGGATAFNRTYEFGDINLLTPSDASGFVRLNLTFEMRSNTDYRLAASSVDGVASSPLPANLVGYSIKSVTASTATPTQVVSPRADAPPTTAPFNASWTTVNGVYDPAADIVTYKSTLADLATETDILIGNRISNRGGLNSANNFILVSSEFVFRPELFASAGNILHTVTFTAYPRP